MSSITLSAGVRQSLSALQSAAAQSSVIQNRLATGKKVNSALDNPSSFFTASGLSNRAADLNRLLDDMGQAVKTIESADKGMKGITKLVENAQSIAKQALASSDVATRTTLKAQYDAIRTQIDEMAGDASYNGVNLIDGDNLTVTFNEDATSTLDITGVTSDAAGLAITAAGDWENATIATGTTAIEADLALLTTAVTTLRTNAAKFGTNLSIVQNRQDFTEGMIDTLTAGSDLLIVADPNEEGANLLALNTRSQIAQTTLAMASQADSAVLRLF
jgi:flagellin